MKNNSKRNLVKHAIKQFCILLLVHLVAMLVYGLFLSNSVAHMVLDEEIAEANLAVFWFGIVVCAMFSVIYTKADVSFVDYRKGLKESLRAGKSFWAIFREKHLAKDLVKVLVFAFVQIPFLIFSFFVDLSLVLPLFIESFYVMNMGSYLMTGNPLLGILLDTLLFGGIFILFRLLFLFLSCRDVKKEMI
ncbi:MAG: hypothetical protein IJD64_00905 [Clostridia bacterium]|nr:hypothetical protein [Clostridia bacterium]